MMLYKIYFVSCIRPFCNLSNPFSHAYKQPVAIQVLFKSSHCTGVIFSKSYSEPFLLLEIPSCSTNFQNFCLLDYQSCSIGFLEAPVILELLKKNSGFLENLSCYDRRISQTPWKLWFRSSDY